MPKGINIVENTGYDQADDGVHYVKGFEFITTDDSGAPHFVPDEYKGMVTRIKFINAIEDQAGPAMSLKPAEFIALVRLFGVNDFNPTKQNRTLSPVLLEGMRKANESKTKLSVVSKKGWVNYLDGLRLPEGRYTVKFSGSYPRDGAWITGQNSQYINLFFDVVGDTVWEGFTIRVALNNIFLDKRNDEEGFEHTAQDDGKPILAGGINQRRWVNFGMFFCNNIWERHDWKVKPSDSKYGVCEVLEPQKVLIAEAAEAKAEVSVWFEKKEKSDNYHFEMADLAKFNEVNQDRSATSAEFVEFVKSRTWNYVNEAKEEVTIDVDTIFQTEDPITFVLNDEGKSEWGRQFLLSPWEMANLNPDDRRFDLLSPTELGRLMGAMESLYA